MRGREIESIGGLNDALSGCCADAGDAAQRTRDRPFVDTCFPRYVSNRGASSRRRRPRRDHPGVSFSEHDFNYTAGGRGEQSLFLPLTRGIV